MSKMQIIENDTYTLPEVIDYVQWTLNRVSEKSENIELQYSSTDLYWLLYDMIRYINRNIPGEFILLQTQKGTYRVTYAAENSAKQKANRKLEAEVDRTAKYLEDLTGEKPLWVRNKKKQSTDRGA